MGGSDAVWRITEETLRTECKVRSEISPDTDLFTDLGLDSLALMTLAVAAEDHFRICLNEDPAAPPRTVGDFVALVHARLAEQGRDAESR